MAFGRKAKTLFQAMALNETVASSVYDRLRELYDDSDTRGAIVKTDSDKFIVLAVLESDVLEYFGGNQKKAVKNEDLGAFAANINNKNIDAIVLENDIVTNGFLGIIPEKNTLEDILELDFINSIDLHMAIVDSDFNEEQGLMVLTSVVTTTDLKNIKNGHATIVLENEGTDDVEGSVVKLSDLPAEPEVDSDGDTDYNDFDESEPVVDEETDIYSTTNEVSDDLFGDTISDYVYEPQVSPIVESHDLFENETPDTNQSEYVYQPQTELASTPVYEAPVQPMQVVDLKDLLNSQELVLKKMESDSLDITIDASTFDSIYGSDAFVLELIDDEVLDQNNELEVHVAEMARLANSKLIRNLDKITNEYRTEYLLTMRTYYSQLASKLDYHNKETESGKRYLEILNEKDQFIQDAVANNKELVVQINEEYHDKREAYGRLAYDRAVIEFDETHAEQHKRDIELNMADIDIEADNLQRANLEELHNHRRDVAKAFIADAETKLLTIYDKKFKEAIAVQHELYEQESAEIDRYLEEHYSHEVQRAQAIKDSLAYNNTLETLKGQHEVELASVESKLEQLRKESNAQLEKVKDDAVLDLNTLRKEMSDSLKSERDINAELRKELKDFSEKYYELDERKEREHEHRHIVAKDRISALEQKIDYNDRETIRNNRNRWILTGILATLSIILSIAGTTAILSAKNANDIEARKTREAELKEKLTDAEKKADDAVNQVTDLQGQLDAIRNAQIAAQQQQQQSTAPAQTVPVAPAATEVAPQAQSVPTTAISGVDTSIPTISTPTQETLNTQTYVQVQ